MWATIVVQNDVGTPEHLQLLFNQRSIPIICKRSQHVAQWGFVMEDSFRGGTYKKNIIRTPNILAMSQRLLDTRDQYFNSSFCAP